MKLVYVPYRRRSFPWRRYRRMRYKAMKYRKRARRIRRKWPRRDYGVMHLPRGADKNPLYNVVGKSWADATDAQKEVRRKTGWRGPGYYEGSGGYGRGLNSVLKGIGRVNSFAQSVGGVRGVLSNLIGSGLYTGHGSYGTHSNNLVEGGLTSNSVPAVGGVGDETGGMIFTHCEYLTDIYGPTSAFNNQVYFINPGLAGTFPWLSQLAANYEEYQILQCLFEYRSTTTDIGSSTTGQCGTIVMATNYNVRDDPFTDKSEMMSYAHAHSCKLTENMVHGVECDPSKLNGDAQKFVRSTGVPAGSDPTTYDHGLFQLAICNSPTAYQNFPVGELWVSYTVKLRKPKIATNRGYAILQDRIRTATNQGAGNNVLGNGTLPLYYAVTNNLGCKITQGTNSGNGFTITFPAGFSGFVEVKVWAVPNTAWAATSAIIDMPSNLATGNVVFLNDVGFYNIVGNSIKTQSQLANHPMMAFFHLKISPATGGVNNAVTVTGFANNTTTCTGYCTIAVYNSYPVTNSTERVVYLKSDTGTLFAEGSF